MTDKKEEDVKKYIDPKTINKYDPYQVKAKLDEEITEVSPKIEYL